MISICLSRGPIPNPHHHSLFFKPSPPSPYLLRPLLFPTRRRRHRHRHRILLLRPRASHLLSALDSAPSVLEASAVLAAIIVVHELGHFLAASLQGIHVSKFAIGFGPVLARFVSGSVEYSLRAFPLGGFVGFPDDDPDSGIPPDDADLLKNRPIPDRLLVVSAGVAANLLFAYLIVFSEVISVGLPVQKPLAGVLVPEVRSGSAAARDGLRPGDVILGVENIAFPSAPSVSEVVDVIKMSPKKSVPLRVLRGGAGSEPMVVNVVPDQSSDGSGRIGVQLSPNYSVSKLRASDLAEATRLAGKEFWGLATVVVDGLKQTFLNFSQSASKVSGPVAIIAVGAEVAKSSSDGLFQFAAVINLNLAVINLLPLPALDGGSLALLLVEAARGGRKLPRELEQRIMSSGILVVLMLGLFLIVRDTLNLDFIKEML
ncbi:probable membrane metalloprotease ARASP2, chloroplastic [Dioscorea cayenensis subsp. rotundata]|uniref:Probable membrane metalloprotease ARASP2, chloroplastic n=1 Tax=Dioscorea cayennensis subsp. rotundata TaxID=55577 RepID=A0AB40BUH9_DIOCR|nr:probable membrane metalloprotease ARASP2, chloroplastic [Dioscorea cayenensis subsp. rotundata]